MLLNALKGIIIRAMATEHHPLTCGYCGQTYKTKRNWYQHELLCELKHSTTLSQHNKQETYTTQELTMIVRELMSKQLQMEKEIAELRRKAVIKVNILEWLNANIKPTLSYKSLIENLAHVKDTDIADINTIPLQQLIKTIIERNALNYKATNPKHTDWPLFIYTSNNQNQPRIYLYDYFKKTWIETTDLSANIWRYVSNAILAYLFEWKQINGIMDDTKSIEFNMTLMKMTDTKKEPSYLQTIKSTLVKHLAAPSNNSTHLVV